MASLTRSDLLDALTSENFLTKDQQEDLMTFVDQFDEPKTLTRELYKRGFITRYQAQQIVAGNLSKLTVGSYRLLELVGEGGMGQVYRARQLNVDRTVALKVIRKEHLSNPKAIRRFQREIEASAQLSDMHVVRSFDADCADNTYYIAMEFIEGTDLARLVKDGGPLLIGQACDYVRQAALGLQHAFEKGLVHRDIKPANMLVTWAPSQNRIGSNPKPWVRVKDDSRPELTPASVIPYSWGLIKLLDLGLARWTGDNVERTALTMMGSVMGTPEYIAPEQARNSSTSDIRADLYSLGGAFYFMLTGSPPFPSGNLTQKLLQHQFDQPEPPTQVRREAIANRAQAGLPRPKKSQFDVPADVEAIVRKLMEKKPEDRYQTPQELVVALESVMDRLNRGLPLQGSNPDDTAATVVLPSEDDVETSKPEGANLDASSSESLPNFEPVHLHQRRRLPAFMTSRTTRLVGLGVGIAAVFLLAMSALSRVARERTERTGNKPQYGQLTDSAAAWKSFLGKLDGNKHTFSELRDELGRLRKAHPNAEFQKEAEEIASRLPSELDNFDRNQIGLKGLKAKLPPEAAGLLVNPKEFFPKPILYVKTSSDGRWVVTNDGPATRIVDLYTPGLPSTFQPHGNQKVHCLAIAPNARHAASGADDGSLLLWDIAHQKILRTFATSDQSIRQVAFSPDGKRLAAASADGVIRLFDVEADRPTHLWTTPCADIYALTFSPDGRAVFWSSDSHIRWSPTSAGEFDPQRHLNILTKPNRVLTFHPTKPILACGGEGGRLMFCEWDGDKLVDRAVLKETQGPIVQASFSPDGKLLITGGADNSIVLWDVEARRVRKQWRFRGPVTCVDFAPDNRHFIVGGLNGLAMIYRLAPPGISSANNQASSAGDDSKSEP